MKQVLIKQGEVVVEEVPPPQVEEGHILVRVNYSCISIGTELSGLQASGDPIWSRAIKYPEKIKKAMEMATTKGVGHTISHIQRKLASAQPTGYSAAGEVLEVGAGIRNLKVYDRVACAGAQCAHHAEIIRVPKNLCVRVPDSVDMSSASTVALGAIALQGVRRAQPTLGETFVVLGLGFLGQITIQLLEAYGCRVIGMDLEKERINLAMQLGMESGIQSEEVPEKEDLLRRTDGVGADGVIITAATSSNEVISKAFQVCRRKGRVVLVGDVGLNLDRADFYQKELDFFISTSYGPGRYDQDYEEGGIDYPLPYVRWTENRNMAEYLRLISNDKIKLSPLLPKTYSVEQASEAYESLKNGQEKPLMVVLSYPQRDRDHDLSQTVSNPSARGAGSSHIRLAVVGAGAFAKEMHLPNLKLLSNQYHLQAVVSRTGHNAQSVAKQFGANYSTTDFKEVLNDPEVNAVLIATRHDLHATMTLDALKAGKHVLVEKPLALMNPELQKIETFYRSCEEENSRPILLTGFNRRFSSFARRLHELVKNRTNPMILNYSMNAGYIPLDHWVHTASGGGRNRGEACHIYDLFTYLTNARVKDVMAKSITARSGYYSNQDNFVATITFEDGSLATLTYTALGTRDYPKERLEVFCEGKVLCLNDYKSLTIAGAKEQGLETRGIEKGQKAELEAFATAIQRGGEWPIPLWQQVQVTRISFEVEKDLIQDTHR
jgi:predicted dehydrogenase/threonine dehydrogenase-like Zn-dependent dehydrogenase